MDKVKIVLRRLIKKLRARLSEELPQNEAAVLQFAEEVISLGGFPSNDSFVHAIATQIMHVNSDQIHVRKINFVNALKRSIANQSAYNILSSLKEKQRDEAAQKANEVTVQGTTSEVVSTPS